MYAVAPELNSRESRLRLSFGVGALSACALAGCSAPPVALPAEPSLTAGVIPDGWWAQVQLAIEAENRAIRVDGPSFVALGPRVACAAPPQLCTSREGMHATSARC
jgi:hypothetical protein